jgi:DNA (cytosine-5)-methyltransferase 1
MIYLNEYDPYAAEWLRNLIREGLIPEGEVDERSIRDVQPGDLRGFTQCHFFAGIAGWPLALQLAGVDAREPLWTGSAPCQPFSAAGKGKGVEDDRHLWPEFYRLIRECGPSRVFGEQVASSLGLGWLDGVFADLEGSGYAVGAADLCAAGVGSPHIRQRLFWVANRNGERFEGRTEQDFIEEQPREPASRRDDACRCGNSCGLANADEVGHDRGQATIGRHADDTKQVETDSGPVERLGHTDDTGPQERIGDGRVQRGTGRPHKGQAAELRSDVDGLEHATSDGRVARRPESDGRGIASGRGDVLIPCRDGKTRRVGPGISPLAYGVPTKRSDMRMGFLLARMGELGNSAADIKRILREARANRVGRLRGYGNAIVPQVAAEFIKAAIEASK